MSGDEQALREGLPSGTELGEYEVEAAIGQGGFGVVYRAKHRYLGTVVALKEYLPATVAVRIEGRVCPRNLAVAADYEEGLRRFIDEARHLVQFRSHPGVVTCVGFFEERGTAYMAMEYEEGLPLSELLTKREAAGHPLDEGELLRLAGQVVESLAVVHQSAVLHRDIKPSNILIRRSDDRPVLIDFGAAKEDFVRYTKSSAPHTQGYAAIEQMEADGKLGPWTDLYGLGAVLWRIVAGGNPPYEPLVPVDALSRMAARFRGQEDPLPSARKLGAGRFSIAVLEAIDQCLELEPAGRPANCGELRELLSVLVEEEPIQMVVRGSRAGDGSAVRRRADQGPMSDAKPPREFGVKRGRAGRALRTTLGSVATTLLVIVGLGLIWHYGTRISVSELRPLLESARAGSLNAEELRQSDRLARIALTLNGLYRSYTRDEAVMYRPYDPHKSQWAGGYVPGRIFIGRNIGALGYPRGDRIEEALDWLRKAAEEGELQAQLWLGWMHRFGRGLPTDHAKAVAWYRKAAALGSSEAQRQLGHSYYFGLGVPRDHTKGIELYREAAGQGDVESQLTLGWRYSRSSRGMDPLEDYTEAARWYRKAAEQGSARAQYLLGQMYKKGQGVPLDHPSAYAWTNLAAAQGHDEAEKERDLLESEMTSIQISEGQSLTQKIAGAIDLRDR